MEKRIQKLYDGQRWGKAKVALISLSVYLAGLYGATLIRGEEFWNNTWMSEEPHVVAIIAVIAILMGFTVGITDLKRAFRVEDRILFDNCDVREYEVLMEAAYAYGKEIKYKGWQRSVFLSVQQRLIVAYFCGLHFTEAEDFLENRWMGKKEGKLYRHCRNNYLLVKAFSEEDLPSFQQEYKKAIKSLQKNKVVQAQEQYLLGNYDEAVTLVEQDKPRDIYNRVTGVYLKAMCYRKMGQVDKEREALSFVTLHGGTMPCKEISEARLREIS